MELSDTFEYNLRAEIDDVTFDYLVTADIYGYIHSVQCSFFELPQSVQQLIIGTPNLNTLTKIKNRGLIFQYELILILAGYLRDQENPAYALAKEIEKRLAKRNKKWTEIPFHSNMPVQILWWGISYETPPRGAAARSPEIHNEPFLLPLLNFKSPTNKEKAIDHLSKYGGITGQEVLINLLPFFNADNRIMALKALFNFPNQKTKAVLIHELQLPDNQDWVEGVLYALRSHKGRDIQEALASFYYSIETPADNTLYNLAVTLNDHPCFETTQILLKILRQWKERSSVMTASVLIRHNYPQPAMVDEIWPMVTVNDMSTKESAFSALSIIDRKFLPDGNSIWEAFVNSPRHSSTLCFSMTMLLKKVRLTNLASLITETLTSGSDNAILSVLKMLSSYYPTSGRALKSNQEVKSVIFSLLDSNNIQILMETVRVLPKIIKKNKRMEFITKTADLYRKHENNISFCQEILRSWDAYFQTHRYSEQAEVICLEALEHANYNMRALAIGVLRYSYKASVQHHLQAMRNDPDKHVREAAMQEKKRPFNILRLPELLYIALYILFFSTLVLVVRLLTEKRNNRKNGGF